jgi:hypothetical protein
MSFMSNEKRKKRYSEQFIYSSFQTITNFNMPYIQFFKDEPSGNEIQQKK